MGIFMLLISISNSKTNKILNDRIDNIHERLLKLEYPKDGATIAELKYRMDVFEGKHLRARNLGMGLPQPRPREKNGD
jgi:hypothetical protein